jgi:hypothetical protein
MKFIIKCLIAAAILNAAARTGMAAAAYYQLKDQSLELVTFNAKASPGEIEQQILNTAQDLDVPLDPADVEVSRNGLHTTATASYTQPVEVFPDYIYPMNFHFTVDAFSMAGLDGKTDHYKR